MADQSWLTDIFGRDRRADPLQTLRSEIERVFEDFPKNLGVSTSGVGVLRPTLDVSETDDGVRVTVELPGVDESDIDVTLADDVLTIKGEKKSEREEKSETFFRSERSYGMFQRSIPVPSGLDPASVTATMKDGVLEIALPKPPEAKASARKIAISRT